MPANISQLFTICCRLIDCRFPTVSSSECSSGTLTFELITGHVYTSPADTVTMIPGVLHLSECLEHCHNNQSCKSLNFETGLCVLLSSSALQRPFALTPSQFPVFTIYAHKVCLTGKCQQPTSLLFWSLFVYRVSRFHLNHSLFIHCLCHSRCSLYSLGLVNWTFSCPST